MSKHTRDLVAVMDSLTERSWLGDSFSHVQAKELIFASETVKPRT